MALTPGFPGFACWISCCQLVLSKAMAVAWQRQGSIVGFVACTDPCIVLRGRESCKVPSVPAVGGIQQQSEKEEQQIQPKDSMLKIIQSNGSYNLPFSVCMAAGFGHTDHSLRNLCSSQISHDSSLP